MKSMKLPVPNFFSVFGMHFHVVHFAGMEKFLLLDNNLFSID